MTQERLLTTYILCGGAERWVGNFGSYLQDFFAGRKDELRILDVFFASPHEEWRQKFDDWAGWYNQYLPVAKRELASKSCFAEQVRRAHIIYVHGGRTTRLLQELHDFSEVERLLRGKVYIGSSAGANYLAQHFLSHRGVDAGSAILPMNVVVHYNADNPAERRTVASADALAAAFPAVPTVRLHEGEYIHIER